MLILHHIHCASFAPNIYNYVIKKKKKIIKGEKTVPIINQSFIEKKNKNKNSHGLKLKLENACEGVKTNGFGISRKGREI